MMRARLPEWLRQRIPEPGTMQAMVRLLREKHLHTVCEGAICPNIGGCFARNSTLHILGDTCTRRCAFCAVKKGAPLPVDEKEPYHIVEAVQALGLAYVVITSVTRDDLDDGGASHFAAVIEQFGSTMSASVWRSSFPILAARKGRKESRRGKAARYQSQY